jgi:hypothetical protein
VSVDKTELARLSAAETRHSANVDDFSEVAIELLNNQLPSKLLVTAC